MHRTTARAAALTLVALPWLSACAIGASSPSSATTSASPSAAAPTIPAAANSQTLAAPTGAHLTAALPPLPTGARSWVASTGPNGLLDAAGFVSAAFGKANVMADLPIELNRGLQSGARWTWAAKNGQLTEILLARFRSDVGAQSYYLMEHAAKLKKYPSVTPTPVPGITTSFTLAIPTLDSYGNAVVRVHAVAGDTVIIINVLNPATPDETTANTLALQIARKLCADQGCSLN
jgi:hypothetical protein